MLTSVNLRDYMLTNPAKVNENVHLSEAMKSIIDNKVSGLCIVDDAGNFVGILSEMDCLNAILNATYNNIGVGKVSEYMIKDNILTASPNDDIVDIAQDMLLKKHRRRPVIEEGKLVGQVTCRQLLAAVNKFIS
ncbi:MULTISPECIES: CBS domain-containing protein [Thalassotalea]|uniref:CBS domain-containing protein n=1 Tax=Thalassotalea castellviae TaxID=3075612 RepID=A0ABU3A880_9GAMM|nr:CBS domain-containing protein [Thalassotalea sp. W431]MDT0605308.1 CBS domain-containing protein [Thalassotalea sp. W431]